MSLSTVSRSGDATERPGDHGNGHDSVGIELPDRKSTRLNSSHSQISYAVFCLKKKKSSYFATFLHQLTILSKTDALDAEKWLNMLVTFVKDSFRYELHFVHGIDSLVDILTELR